MNDSRFPPASKTDSRRSLVEACFRREAGSAASIPADSVDLLEAGILDSMAWVSFLRAVETASGVSDLGSGLNERSASLGEVLAALQNSASEMSRTNDAGLHQKISSSPAQAVLTGSSAVPGSRLLPSEEVDRAFGMPAGKLRSRAGIESLAHAAEGENELTLAARAAEEALRAASCGAQEMDWIIATSETHSAAPASVCSMPSPSRNPSSAPGRPGPSSLPLPMFTAARLLPAGLPANLEVYSATAPALLFFEVPLVTIPAKAIASVNSSSAARASTLPRSRSATKETADSPCSSTAKPFHARQSRAWKKFLLPSRCAAASRAAPSAVLQRTNQILAS